ncbi:hypothetical protein M3175_09170 [Robertmurraya korlensis]|uniref:hypothetical protein n=1 Tax=Robertmurraya korlensis TaxID=519977 RepID=UPI002041819F|nr:hypothetical protein [Robertmurraya korlensis]MCM3600901.1 hypothetical protein [Robertmurraya korlensis]
MRDVKISKHAYELGLGAHSFSVEAVDKAGNRSSQSINILVIVDYDRLPSLTDQFLVTNGSTEDLSSFESKLMSAKQSEEKGNTSAHNGQLQAFMNQVKAQSGKAFTEEQAKVLRELAESMVK